MAWKRLTGLFRAPLRPALLDLDQNELRRGGKVDDDLPPFLPVLRALEARRRSVPAGVFWNSTLGSMCSSRSTSMLSVSGPVTWYVPWWASEKSLSRASRLKKATCSQCVLPNIM